jgi:hypothetical protein
MTTGVSGVQAQLVNGESVGHIRGHEYQLYHLTRLHLDSLGVVSPAFPDAQPDHYLVGVTTHEEIAQSGQEKGCKR